jgi:hypothetical protein
VTKKVRRVPCSLDAEGINQLSHGDLVAILRGADDLIMRGGRSILAKLLKGSRERRLLELGLDKSPAYGYFKGLPVEDVMARIDWTIQSGYLTLEYDYRLPLLVYTDRGWEIEKETYAAELLQGFDRILDSGTTTFDMEYLKDRDRAMILRLLDMVEATRDPEYIPLLRAWQQLDYRKVRERIQGVIESLLRGAS